MIPSRRVAVVLAILACRFLTLAQATEFKSRDEIVVELEGDPERGAAGASDLEVQFESNSATLTPDAVRQLEELAAALAAASLSSSAFRIEGHTDSDGSAPYNQVLSERRAESVKRFLVTRGIAVRRLTARGFGESQPVASEDSAEGKARNRRVAVINLGSQPVAEDQPPIGNVVRRDPTKTRAVPMSPEVRPENTAAPPPAAVATPVTAPNVAFAVEYERNGETLQLQPETVLRPVDNYAVSFIPRARSYVYVVQFDADGSPRMVFPNSAHSGAANPVQAGQKYRVPGGGRWLQLSAKSNQEEIVVLSSGSEIAYPRDVADLVRQGERAPGAPAQLGDIKVPEDLVSHRVPIKKGP